MSNTIIKKIEIQHPTTNIEVDIGAEAQSITVSRNASGEIITDLETEIVDSTETLAETLKEEESPFTGATASANGTKGLVPQPVAGDENKCLFGDATWRESISGSSITITSLEASLNGKQVSISDGTHTKTGTFDSSGICTITGITFVGNLTITSTDGTETATKIVNMPYFGVYVTTLSFWAATVNITGSNELKGALVTVKNSSDVTVGTVTLSSTDATGVFVASEADTYKFNFTYGGKNYSEELEVTTQTTYSLSLSIGFDWQAWLEEGRVSKTFSSLDDILEDEKTLRQLMLVHDAVDYLASQSVDESVEKVFDTDLAAKWINNSDYALDKFYAVADIKTVMDAAGKYGYGEWINNNGTWGPKGNVPVMTSNTAPYGEASATSVYNATYYAPYLAFRGKWDGTGGSGNCWQSGNGQTTNQRIAYKFSNPVCPKAFEIMNETSSNCAPKTVKLQGSNDGTNWVDISDVISCDITASKRTRYTVENDNYYLYVGLLCLTNNGGVVIALNTLQFYGRELKVSVPTMTSNTAPFGEVSASGFYSSYYPYDVFVNGSSGWIAGNSTTNPYISYKFNSPIKLKLLSINPNFMARTNNDFKVLGKDLQDNWVEIISLTGLTDTITSFFTISNNILFTELKITYSLVAAVNSNQILSIQFYGLDYSEKEFEVGTTKKWLYDHGVELETATLWNSNSSATGEKTSNSLIIRKTGSNNVSQFCFPKINLTSYSLMRIKLGHNIVEYSNNMGSLVASLIEHYDYSSVSQRAAYKQMALNSGNTPNNEFLDISSVNQSCYPQFAIGSSGSVAVTNELVEFWLE